MFHTRLAHALETGALAIPDEGDILVIGPTTDTNLATLPRERLVVYSRFHPEHRYWQDRGYQVVSTLAEETFSLVLVIAPRSKALARAWLHAANAVSEGWVWIDGQKTDGMDSHLKALKSRSSSLHSLSKAHGKLVWCNDLDVADWAISDTVLPEGFITRPGVFSADGIDKGSAALVAAMPPAINGRVADLGAGWGFLSRHILSRDGVTSLDLIEADLVALECARRNIDDPRASFIWDDATSYTPGEPYDVVISNPPFHTGRKGDLDLGRAFIRTAAGILKVSGRFVMVANRHLPYETELAQHFREVEDLGGTPGFKILSGSKPRRARA